MKINVGIWFGMDLTQEEEILYKSNISSLLTEKEWHASYAYRSNKDGLPVLKDEMYTHVLDDKIKGVIFPSIAHVAGTMENFFEFVEYFREKNAFLFFSDIGIGTNSDSGKLLFSLSEAMNYWRDKKILESKPALLDRARKGKSIGGAAPFGYRRINGELELDPNEALIRKRIYELFVQEKRKKTVARILNQEGHRTRRGKTFSSQTITVILRDPISKGLRRLNHSTLQKGKHVRKDMDEWIFIRVPAIVGKELWEQCNDILDEHLFGESPSKKPRYLFSGHIRCECGGKMYVPTKTNKYTCQGCRNKMPVDDMEGVFLGQLKGMGKDAQRLCSHWKDFSFTEKLEVVNLLVSKVSIGDGSVGFVLK